MDVDLLEQRTHLLEQRRCSPDRVGARPAVSESSQGRPARSVRHREAARAPAPRARAAATPRSAAPANFDRVEEAVHRAPRRLVGAFHRREVGVRAHVVGRKEQVRDGGRRVRTQPPGVDEVHQQRLGVRQKARVGRGRRRCPGRGTRSAGLRRAGAPRSTLIERLSCRQSPARPLRGSIASRGGRRSPGPSQSEMSTEMTPCTSLSPNCSRRHAPPELELRDARQRPFGIDVDHMPVCYRHVAAQVELDAVHPFDVRGQRAQIGQRRVGREQPVVHQRGDALERQRGHVVVAVTTRSALPFAVTATPVIATPSQRISSTSVSSR